MPSYHMHMHSFPLMHMHSMQIRNLERTQGVLAHLPGIHLRMVDRSTSNEVEGIKRASNEDTKDQ